MKIKKKKKKKEKKKAKEQSDIYTTSSQKEVLSRFCRLKKQFLVYLEGH